MSNETLWIKLIFFKSQLYFFAVTRDEFSVENIIPNSLGEEYSNNFNRYTNVVTPNGGKIHIVAQSNLTDEQIVRARSTLEHFLKNYQGSKYGSDKSELANKMSENGAILTLLNGQDNGNNPVEVSGQALFENEIQIEDFDKII